jgi:hypothetical protein
MISLILSCLQLLSSGIDAKGWKEDALKKKKKKVEKKKTEVDTSSRSAPAEPVAESEPKSAMTNSKALFAIIFVILLAILLQVFHMYISAPIKPGHVVSPGVWLSKCGLLAVLPHCDNAFLNVSKDGKVILYNADHEIAWEMKGAVCSESDEKCIRGLHVMENGNLAIGGKSIQWLNMYKPSDLSPWPFTEKPRVKVWKK